MLVIKESHRDFVQSEPWGGKQKRNCSVVTSNSYFIIIHYSVKKLLLTLTYEQADKVCVMPSGHWVLQFTHEFHWECSSDLALQLLFPFRVFK